MEPPPPLYQNRSGPLTAFAIMVDFKGQGQASRLRNLLPEQCRDARGPLDWTRERLAASAGVEETGRTPRTRPAGARNKKATKEPSGDRKSTRLNSSH